MTKFAFLAFVCLTIHFTYGGHVQGECPTICPAHYAPVCGSDGKTYGNACQLGVATCQSGGTVTLANNGTCATKQTKKLKKCPLDYKKKDYSKKVQCIDLQPPTDVEEALQTCWQEAINVKFVCVKREGYRSMMRSRHGSKSRTSSSSRRHHRRHHHHHKANKNATEEATTTGSTDEMKSKSREERIKAWKAKMKNRKKGSWGKRQGHSMRRRMFKMVIFKHLILKNLPWWIFFTKDVSPPVFPSLVPEVKQKIQNNFRKCFLKKTNIGFEDKINTEQLIGKLRLYKGHESNTTLVVNLIQKCSENATYQSEFARCMTRNIAVTCIRKHVADNKHKWGKYMKNKDETEKDEETDDDKKTEDEKKAEDKENDEITNNIVSNHVSSGDDTKDDADAKKSYSKSSSSRKGKSNDDDDDDDDDTDKKSDKPSREERIKAWKEKMKSYKSKSKGQAIKHSKGKSNWWSHMKRCEPCFNLKSSEAMKAIFKQCWESSSKDNYYSKIKTCMKAKEEKKDEKEIKEREAMKAKYMAKYLDSAWMKLFKPCTKKSLYMSEDFKNNKLNCIFGKLGLGTTDTIDNKGYTEMIKTHLIGDEKVKEVLIKTVLKCGGAKPEGKTNFGKFGECTLPMLETSCGLGQ